MTSPVRVIVVGAGNRGEIYGQFASIHPERVKVSRHILHKVSVSQMIQDEITEIPMKFSCEV